MVKQRTSSGPARARRWSLLAGPLPGMLLLVVLAHLLLLQGMSFGLPASRTAASAVPVKAAALQVRQIEAPMPVQLAGPEPWPWQPAEMVPGVPSQLTQPAPAAPAALTAPRSVQPAPTRPAAPAPAVAAAPRESSAEPVAPQAAPAAPAEAGLPEASAEAPTHGLLLVAAAASPRANSPSTSPATTSSAAGPVNVPVYATRLPAPVQLRYELRRGAISGSGELRWRPAEGRYQMEMEGRVFGINALGWVSQGRLDAAGIAPERFVDRRRGRDAQAANFQRDKGIVTYSGASAVHPLVPGAQDRLSFMLQLSAIVDAAPAKFGVGARIPLFVSGARGDADVWTFIVEAADTLDLPAGRVPGALHIRREPRKPYDTRAEVWLDPARSHLPVRLRLSSAERDEVTDFLLREVAAP